MRLRLWCIFFLASCFSCKQETGTIATSEQYSETGYYSEKYRPQFHFSPEKMWMNDPNGMVFYEGEYHLFYQYHPDSTVWGPMHWGHAVSTDLVSWEHLPIGLYPDSLGLIFSGSAVVDWNNTSGFGKEGNPPLVAIFTHHLMEGEKSGRKDFQYQSIAYSNDKGRTWTKYKNNPVIDNPGIRDFRDPKVIWDKDSDQWVMLFAARDRVRLYGSPDLKNWEFLSEFGAVEGTHAGVWECPDLFPMKVEGTEETKWVILQSMNPGGPNGGSCTQYFVGDFNGKTFIEDPVFKNMLTKDSAVWLEYGRDNYAGVTWSDIPEKDGRRIFMGWMSNWDYAQVVPTQTWRSAMTLPRSLSLHRIGEELRIFSNPVKELDQLSIKEDSIATGKIEGNRTLGDGNGKLRVKLNLSLLQDPALEIRFSNEMGQYYSFGYDHTTKRFYSDRRNAGEKGFSEKFAPNVHYAPRIMEKESLDLDIFLDHSSIEIFADQGSIVFSELFFPDTPFTKVVLSGRELSIEEGSLHRLKSIWN